MKFNSINGEIISSQGNAYKVKKDLGTFKVDKESFVFTVTNKGSTDTGEIHRDSAGSGWTINFEGGAPIGIDDKTVDQIKEYLGL